MKNPCPYSWKKCTFAHKLCENGQSSESQHACMIGRVAPDEGKANGLHLGKERASKLAVTIYLLGTRFAPSLSHVFSKRHHFLLLNFSLELRPRKRFYEQDLTSIGVCASSADSSVGCKGCRRPEWEYGRGLRFLYAHTDSASPYQTLMREL